MTIYAECHPAHGPIHSISVYAVEGEVGCRVSELRADRCVRYRSTATAAEFIAQHKHLGPWEITGRNTGDCNGNPDGAEGHAEEAEIEVLVQRRGRHDVYGQDILSGRGPYSCRLGQAEQGADHDQARS
jgi:hypothetical protein